MRPNLTTHLVVLAAITCGCKSSEFKGTGGTTGGATRNSGDSTKEDLLNNSAFDDGDDGDSLGSKDGEAKDQADLDSDVNSDDSGNPNAADSMVDIIRLCSNRYTEQAGTNLKASATGAVVSLHPTPDNTNGKAVHFHTAQNAAQIRKDVMNYGKFKLPLQKVRGGAYTLLLCDASFASTCKATPAVVETPPTTFVNPRGGRPITTFGTGVRFGATRGVLGSGIVQVKEGKIVNVTGSFLPAGQAQLIEVLTDKNLEDTAMQQSFMNMFASMSGAAAQPFQPLSKDDLASIQDCDESASPLIIDTDNKGIKVSEPFPGVAFDVDANGRMDHISWPAKDDMFVTLDLNANGVVDNGAELFGDNSPGPDGAKAADGFLALAKYDDNRDGVIDAKDDVCAKLRLWSDDGDGVSQAAELLTLDSQGIESIDLAYKEGLEKDHFANQTRQRSVVRLKSGVFRMVVDLWFRVL